MLKNKYWEKSSIFSTTQMRSTNTLLYLYIVGILLICLSQQSATSSTSNWHYMAYFPRIFRTGIHENVLVSTHGFPDRVQVTLQLLNSENNDAVYREKQNKTIEPGVLTQIPIYIPHDSPRYLKVKLDGLSTDNRWRFTNTSNRVTVQKLGLNVFLQTDRPIYKPGF